MSSTEGEGVEPPRPFIARRFSRAVPSPIGLPLQIQLKYFMVTYVPKNAPRAAGIISIGFSTYSNVTKLPASMIAADTSEAFNFLLFAAACT